MGQGEPARDRILESAGEVFAERGYEAATVREICRRAGVNIASVNYYFGGKERLYAELLHRAHARHPEPPDLADSVPGVAPQEQLRAFIRNMLAHLLRESEDPWEARLMTREVLEPTRVGRAILRRHFQERLAVLLAIVDGLVPAATTKYQRWRVALSIVGQCLYYRVAAKILPLVLSRRELREQFDLDSLSDHIARFSLAALGHARPAASPPGGNGADLAAPCAPSSPAVARRADAAAPPRRRRVLMKGRP